MLFAVLAQHTKSVHLSLQEDTLVNDVSPLLNLETPQLGLVRTIQEDRGQVKANWTVWTFVRLLHR